MQYDFDENAWPSVLGSGTYYWSVVVRDEYGNEATQQAQYTVP